MSLFVWVIAFAFQFKGNVIEILGMWIERPLSRSPISSGHAAAFILIETL